jgi:hypothetical protein
VIDPGSGSDDPVTTTPDAGAGEGAGVGPGGAPGGRPIDPDQADDGPPDLGVGLIAAPGLPAELAPRLAEELYERLTRQYPSVRSRVSVLRDGLLTPPAVTTELLEAARDRLLDQHWDLVVCLTDLPLRLGRRPVVGHTSRTHGVALLSVPALGAVAVQRRARDAVFDLVDELLGEDQDAAPAGPRADRAGSRRRRRVRRRVDELADLGDEQVGAGPAARMTALLAGGNLRLLVGMVRANRPWRFALGLYRALVAALAAVAFALVTSDIWRIAAALGPLKQSALMVASLVVTSASLIAVHDLWEHSRQPHDRAQVALFNLATTATVAIGVATLYAALFAVTFVSAALLLAPDLLGSAFGRHAGPGAYARLAWLVSSLATVGGALGAGLETEDAVRRAAYAIRPDATTPSAATDAPYRNGSDDQRQDQAGDHTGRPGGGHQ